MHVAPSSTSTCNTCSTELAEHPPGKERICLECRRARGRLHYRSNRDYYLEKARRHRKVAVSRSWEFILEYLRENHCVDCGASDPRVLEFDHREGSCKRASISVLVTEGYSLDAIATEIEKCDVRCANCHTIRTREQAGWFRSHLWRARRDSNSQPFDP